MAVGYLALADELEATIDDLDPGSRLPSEHKLCAERGVSRVTARSAIRELESRHLVRRVRGSGTFVALRLPYPLRAGVSPSWSQIVRANGHVPAYRVVATTARPAGPHLSESLLIPRTDRVVGIERVGLVDDLVAVHQRMWFPEAVVPDLLDVIRPGEGTDQSTTLLLHDRYGIDIERSSTLAELRPITSEIAPLLELVGRPMAWNTHTVNRCRSSRRPVERSEAWLRADCFRVFMEFGPSDGPSPVLDPSPPA